MGKKDLSEIVRVGQKLSQIQRQRIGFRLRTRTRFASTPSYNVYREVLQRIDLGNFGKLLTDWLSAHRGHLPATLAMDGKTIRAHLGLVVTLLDTEQGVPVAIAADTRGKGYETACARQLLDSDSVSLLNTIIIADSLHTNHQNAQLIVQEKGGDYIAALKDNQPTLHQLAHKKLDGTPPLLPIAKAVAVLPMTAQCASSR